MFKTLKRKLTEAPILIRPNWKRKFTLYTDASSLGPGAVLTQQDDEGRERIVLYASSRTNRIPLRSNEARMLSRSLGREAVTTLFTFDIVTDHQALPWLFNKGPEEIYA